MVNFDVVKDVGDWIWLDSILLFKLVWYIIWLGCLKDNVCLDRFVRCLLVGWMGVLVVVLVSVSGYFRLVVLGLW